MREIDELYSDITACINLASEVLPPSRSKLNYRVIPGWNKFCREKYNFARNKYMLLFGPLFEEMETFRADFKKALRFCKNNKMKIQKKMLCY